MANYSIQSSRSGDITIIPDNANLLINDLIIIGDGKTDWNEPYNKNFMKLDDKVFSLETAISNLPLPEVYVKPTSEPISYITGLQNALDLKASVSYVDTAVTGLANVSYVDTAIVGLASTSYVDSAVAEVTFTLPNVLTRFSVDADGVTLLFDGAQIVSAGGGFDQTSTEIISELPLV